MVRLRSIEAHMAFKVDMTFAEKRPLCTMMVQGRTGVVLGFANFLFFSSCLLSIDT